MKRYKAHSVMSMLSVGWLFVLTGCLGLLDPNDYNRGIIFATYPQTATPAEKRSCYEPAVLYNSSQKGLNNIVIDNDSSFRSYFDSQLYNDSTRFSSNFPCRNYQLEAIDFTKYTLLGNYADGGCEVAFTRTVERDDELKRYVYTVKVREAGTCKRLEYSMNWVLVPKLPVGYRVAFLTK